MVDTINFHGVSMTFADVVASDTPMIFDNYFIWMFSSYIEFTTNFSTTSCLDFAVYEFACSLACFAGLINSCI